MEQSLIHLSTRTKENDHGTENHPPALHSQHRRGSGGVGARARQSCAAWAAEKKTLKLLQWSHFVPSYDTWFDQYCKSWGEKNNVNVVVDHISLSDLKSTFSAEVVAGKGHDLVEFIAPPSDFEPSVLDLSDLNQEAAKRFGDQLPVATKSSYNPHTKKYYGFCHGLDHRPRRLPQVPLDQGGLAGGPRTWDELLNHRRENLRTRAIQAGIGMSQELDSNMAGRAVLWSFDTSIQDAHEKVVLDNKKTIEAVKYMADLYKRALTPEVFSWNPASNNQLLIAGRASYILNSISAYRSAQKDVPEIAKDIYFTPALKGPGGTGWASEHVIYVSVIPKFARQPDLAKQFLLDLCTNYDEAMWESKLYNTPSFFQTRIPSGDRGYPSLGGAKTVRDAFPDLVQQGSLRPEGRGDRETQVPFSTQKAGAPTWGTRDRPARPSARSSAPSSFPTCSPRCPGAEERRGSGEGGGRPVPPDLRQMAQAGPGRRKGVGRWPTSNSGG